MALPTTIFSGHFSRVFYTTTDFSGSPVTLTQSASAMKSSFETGTHLELKSVRAIPSLAESSATATYPVFGSSYNIQLPSQKTLTGGKFICNYLASEQTTIDSSIQTGKLVIVCVAISAQEIANYAATNVVGAQVARYYAWGQFIDRSINVETTDAVTVEYSFLPMSPWGGPI